MSTDPLCIRCLRMPPTEGNLCKHCAKPAEFTLTKGLCLLCATPVAPEHSYCETHAKDEEEHIVIIDTASRLVLLQKLGTGLEVTIEVHGDNIIVRGAGLDDYLAHLDPDVWNPENARGDA